MYAGWQAYERVTKVTKRAENDKKESEERGDNGTRLKDPSNWH